MGAPPPPADNKGCLKAALIGLAVLVVLGVLGVGALVFAISRVAEKTIGTADAADYELPRDDLNCQLDQVGEMTVSGRFTNKANHRQNYRITVEFWDTDSNTKLADSALITTGPLDSGASTTFRDSVTAPSNPQRIECRVTDVSYFGS